MSHQPDDILSLARSLYQAVQIDEVECEICHSSGMMLLVDPDGHESVGRCSCENGKEFQGLSIVKLDIYRYNQVVESK